MRSRIIQNEDAVHYYKRAKEIKESRNLSWNNVAIVLGLESTHLKNIIARARRLLNEEVKQRR